jgi:hypothetical protein
VDTDQALAALDKGDYLPAAQLIGDKPTQWDPLPIHLAKGSLERGADAINVFLIYGGFTGRRPETAFKGDALGHEPGELLLPKPARWRFRYGLAAIIADALPESLPEWVSLSRLRKEGEAIVEALRQIAPQIAHNPDKPEMGEDILFRILGPARYVEHAVAVGPPPLSVLISEDHWRYALENILPFGLSPFHADGGDKATDYADALSDALSALN